MADDYPKAPPTPAPEALGFTPLQPKVRWFTPSELTRTGAEAVISSLFGAYADNREIQAIRADLKPFCYAEDTGDPPGGGIWVDYVADLGDSWDATYAIASLLAAPTLEVDGVETQRGRLLVLGGDQVYPTATREEYQNRFAGPYRAALPYVKDTPPHLFALPGNHDWYDGLTSFTRLFCQSRWIGGWKTRQSRSYFAIELPGNWWLWGVDIQLNADIDQPQWDYFRDLGRDLGEKHPEGVNIVLCLAEPVWTSAGEDERMAAYDSLAWFEAHTMTRYGHRHAVGLAGDLHAYARWEHADGRQRYISGGGGAYLYPTHRFPDTLRLPTEPGPKLDRATETFTMGRPPNADGTTRDAVYPRRETSKHLAKRALLFPLLNRRFSLFFGAYYLFLAWLVQSASKSLASRETGTFLDILAGLQIGLQPNTLPGASQTLKAAKQSAVKGITTWGDGLWDFLQVLAHAPLAFLTAVVLFGGLAAFADGTTWKWKALLGAGHNTLHLLAFVLLSWLFAWFNLTVVSFPEGLWGEAWGVDHLGQTFLFAVEMLVVGGFVAGVIWGLYLYVANLFGRHTNEVFSCQAIKNYKHFLRLHLDDEGTLTIYPIHINSVPRDWDYQPGADGTRWYLPTGEPLAERVHLIEPPIQVQSAAPPLEGGTMEA